MPDLDICRCEFSEVETQFYFVAYTVPDDIEIDAKIAVFSFSANRHNFKKKFLDALFSNESISSVLDQSIENCYNIKDNVWNIIFNQITEDDYKIALEELQNADNIKNNHNE
jgi:hypothetical protein